jgi:hypothetical protein
LRAREGRETNALNCKPITNLKEKLNFQIISKTSGFLLHAVSCSTNDLHASDGRDTEALNCKPITNL